jgi:hypothetical protein
LYIVSTSSEGYIGQILTKRTFEATGLRRRNLAFEGQKEPHELSPGEEVDAKCPFIVNCDERGFLPATIVRKVHNHAMNDDIYVVKWRLQDLMQLPIYSHLYLRLVEGVSFPDDSPYVEDDTIKRYDIMCLRKGEPDLSASSMWSTSNGIIEPDEMPIDSWLGKWERSQMILDMRKKRRGLLGFEAGDKVFMLDPNVREKTEEFAAGFIYRVISDEHITEYMEAIAEYGKSNKLPYLGKYYVVYPHPTFKTTDWSAFRLDLCCVEFLVKVDESDEAEERRWGALYLKNSKSAQSIRHPKPDDMMDFDFIRCCRLIKMHAPRPQSYWQVVEGISW